jgi:hypothetical protein
MGSDFNLPLDWCNDREYRLATDYSVTASYTSAYRQPLIDPPPFTQLLEHYPHVLRSLTISTLTCPAGR